MWPILAAVVLLNSYNLADCSNFNNCTCVDKKIGKQQNFDVSLESFVKQTDVTYSMNNFNLSVINSNLFNKLGNRSAVQQLDLSNNMINYVQEDTFEGFGSLEKLQLVENYLGKVNATTFKSLDSLVILDLSSNIIETIEEYSFDHLEKLLYLFLRNNCLKTFGAGLLKSKMMHTVDISQNLIVNFPKLDEVITINNLNVSSNIMEEINFVAFNTSVIELDASSNCISRIRTDKNNTHFADSGKLMRRINLARNCLTSIQQLWNMKELKHIDISDNVINFNETFGWLSPFKNLTHLYLTNTSLNSLGVVEKLMTNNFIELSIDKNPLYVDFDSLNTFSLIQSLKFQQKTCYKFRNYKDISEGYPKLKHLSIHFNTSDCECLRKHRKVFRLYNIKFNTDWSVCSNAIILDSNNFLYLFYFAIVIFLRMN